MTVCSCPAVVEVTIVRPDLKYQLGFSVQKGMVCDYLFFFTRKQRQKGGGHLVEVAAFSWSLAELCRTNHVRLHTLGVVAMCFDVSCASYKEKQLDLLRTKINIKLVLHVHVCLEA